jgi:hypothetical protein
MPPSAHNSEPGPAPGVQSPLPADAKHALAAANARFAKIRRAVSVARFNAWTMAIFGSVAVLGGMFNFAALGLGAGLLAASWLEFRGAGAMRRLDRSGPGRLAGNQVFVVAIVAAYCLWNVYRVSSSAPSPLLSELRGVEGGEDIAAQVESLVRPITIGVYFLVTLLTGLFQGLMAIYYLRRRGLIDEYASSTPEWVQDLQRSGSLAA